MTALSECKSEGVSEDAESAPSPLGSPPPLAAPSPDDSDASAWKEIAGEKGELPC